VWFAQRHKKGKIGGRDERTREERKRWKRERRESEVSRIE
jgi:hypothetical protein